MQILKAVTRQPLLHIRTPAELLKAAVFSGFYGYEFSANWGLGNNF